MNIILTSLLSGTWLAFPSNFRVFYLHGQALLVTELMFACGLVTTFGVAVRCNTTIKLESVRCALVACGVKSIPLLATTLGIIVHCNIAIRLEFVFYANEDEVFFLNSPRLHLRVEVSSSASLIYYDSKLQVVLFFFEKIELASL